MKLLVFDGNSIINRAFYGIRLLSTKDGLYTNGLFGFINIFNKQLEDEKPDAAAVAFDLRAPTFRHEMYEGYKAGRKGMPDELAAQMPILKEWLDLCGVKRLEIPGYEADDIIGTIAKCCEAEGSDCVIVTGDRDSLCLLGDRVTVKLAYTKAGRSDSKVYTPEIFKEEYGFAPELLTDYKAICGDSSDNIPGVTGIGCKGASDLVAKFGTLSNIYNNINSEYIKSGVRAKLEAGREQAQLSFALAKIKTDAPTGCSLSELTFGERDTKGLIDLYTKLEMHKFAEKLRAEPLFADADADGPAAPAEDIFIPEPAPLSSAFEAACLSCERLYIDISEKGLCLYYGETMLFADSGVADYPEIVCAVMALPCKKTVHDAKKLLRASVCFGGKARNIDFDCSLAAYLINPSASGYSLPSLCAGYLGREIPDSPAARAYALRPLEEALIKNLKEDGSYDLFREVELPLAGVLFEMERLGFRVDAERLREFSDLLSESEKLLSAQIYDLAGCSFNIGSPKQLGEVLFEKLSLPVVKKTKTGYATDADVLKKLSKWHPIAGLISEYRAVTKLKSTYADGLLKVIDPRDGRIHSTFNQTVTQTGRISSTEPNLQNIPVRTELGREIRKLFIPAEGCVLLDADYSQIELRVLASIAGDKNMIDAFLNEKDIHTATAAQVFGVSEQEVTPELRRRAKAVNFGIVYGISGFSLADDIGVTTPEAKRYIHSYFEYYSGIKQYLDATVEKAREQGFVTTLFGRKRYLPELKSSNYNIRSFGERVAMNTPIQGTAADIIKIAMVKVASSLQAGGFRSRLILQVHDELIVEAPLEEAETAAALLCKEMQGAAELAAPLVAEVKSGACWYDAK